MGKLPLPSGTVPLASGGLKDSLLSEESAEAPVVRYDGLESPLLVLEFWLAIPWVRTMGWKDIAGFVVRAEVEIEEMIG